MLLQPDKSDFIISMIKEVEDHEAISHWTLMENSEVKNKHKNKYGKLKNFLSIWSLKLKILPHGRLTKHKAITWEHEGIQQWGAKITGKIMLQW